MPMIVIPASSIGIVGTGYLSEEWGDMDIWGLGGGENTKAAIRGSCQTPGIKMTSGDRCVVLQHSGL